MSPSWQAQNLPANGNATTTAPTPPSTASFPSQIIARSTEGGDTQPDTPIEKPAEGRDREEDIEMEDADHRRTDHERIADVAKSLEPAPAAPVLYCLSTDPIAPLLPDPAQDMLQLYSLQAMQASVARRDPKTGEKINKLRKSYETKSRNLGIEGRNKATAQEGHLQGLVDPGWDAVVADGVTMWEQKMENFALGGKGTDEMFENLTKAFHFKPGHFLKQSTQSGRNNLAWTSLWWLSDLHSVAFFRALRPDRTGKKRRYDESSYEGYDDDGYSTGGVDDAGRRINGAKRVKRKMAGPV
ncbi:hypothetical protein AMS68_007774 [Peltaster fructicola]|uniref:Mediator of RNA polymerase II transcription subunit 19 n=1 Tax=Peltaster fructicola TaxID=286661 RepID=A0A6H0Y5D1_9PEZI|nr:hypothetical protein AMS68_007774 [Peltaster fructicola]